MAYKKEFIEELEKDIKDEQEAVLGYKKTLQFTDDEHIKKEIGKIIEEEKAHEAFLKELKENPKAVYRDPSDKTDFDEINKKRMGE